MNAVRKTFAAACIVPMTMSIALCTPNIAQAATTVNSAPTSVSSTVNTAAVTSDAQPDPQKGKHAGTHNGKQLGAKNARLSYITKTVGVKGFGWGGFWAGVTLSWSRTRSYAYEYVGAGVGTTAIGLCSKLSKLPYGSYVVPLCAGYIVLWGGRVKSDLDVARRTDKCVQFRWYHFHPEVHAPSRVVSCVRR